MRKHFNGAIHHRGLYYDFVVDFIVLFAMTKINVYRQKSLIVLSFQVFFTCAAVLIVPDLIKVICTANAGDHTLKTSRVVQHLQNCSVFLSTRLGGCTRGTKWRQSS
jgi:hypothetical protein